MPSVLQLLRSSASSFYFLGLWVYIITHISLCECHVEIVDMTKRSATPEGIPMCVWLVPLPTYFHIDTAFLFCASTKGAFHIHCTSTEEAFAFRSGSTKGAFHITELHTTF